MNNPGDFKTLIIGQLMAHELYQYCNQDMPRVEFLHTFLNSPCIKKNVTVAFVKQYQFIGWSKLSLKVL